MRPLRIGVDARPLAHPFTGIGIYLAQVLDSMMANSPHHWILYSNAPFEPPEHWRNQTAKFTERTGSTTSRWQSSVYAQLQFPRWAKEDQIDLFWSPRHQLPLNLPKSLATVVTLHDLVFKTHPETMTRGGALLERLLTPASLRRATRILTTSETMRAELATHYPTVAPRAEVAWLSSNIDHATEAVMPALPNGISYALFCGSIEPRKNLDRLIEAIVSVNTAQLKKDNGTPLHLVIVTGGGWRSDATQKLISQHSELVHVHEAISDSEKAGLYQKALCLALPSLQEGFGLPLVEAMKFELPILTSRRGALPEIAADAALYADPESVASIAAGLTELLICEETRQQLSESARRRAQLFSWDKCAEQTLRTLEDAFESHR